MIALPLGTTLANVLAEDQVLFLGEDFLPWMVLAFGAALVVGNALALVRPPGGEAAAVDSDEPGPTRPPLGRAIAMIVIGLLAAGWGLASLLA